MKVDSQQDSTRYVVSGLHHGSIMPGSRAEMWRNVFLESGANIKGGVWGNDLSISGPDVNVDEAVYCRGSINISQSEEVNRKKNEINFGSNVVSPDSLLMEDTKFNTRFNADLYVGRVKLNQSVVYGNIYATNAIIKNSIVLGGVYCKNKLELINSIVFTFKTKEFKPGKNISLLSPFAIAEKKFNLNHPINALTFYDLLSEKKENSGVIRLDQEDVFEIFYNNDEPVEQQTENSKGLTNSGSLPANVYVLSVVERVLNSGEIIEHFRNNRKIIEFLSFGTHINQTAERAFKNFKKDEVEKALLKIVQDGSEKEELIGSSRMEILLEQFRDLDI